VTSAVQHNHLLEHLNALEGERHPSFSRDRLEAAQDYVETAWRSWGLQVNREAFSYMGDQFVNLIARPAHASAGPRLIIGAHLDTVPGTPGADDNASGLASMLEVARAVAATATAWPIQIEFAGFALEELGMVGSTQYAKRLRRDRAPLLGMLSLEMVGFTELKGLQRYPWFLRGRFPEVGDYIGLAGNARSRGLLNTVAGAMRAIPDLPVETLILPGSGRLFPEVRLSDHAPFWDAGFPALLVTDTAFFRNPHYHQPSDTVATLDLAFLAKVTQGLIAAVDALARAYEMGCSRR